MTSSTTKDRWEFLSQLPQRGPMTPPAIAMLAMADELKPFSGSVTSVLDVGCGPGGVMSQLFETYGKDMNVSRVVASDFSPSMVEALKKRKADEIERKSPEAALWSKVEPVQMDAQDLSEKDASFSHVTTGLTINIVPDPQKALQEALRVLQPDGVIALSAWEGSEWYYALRDSMEEMKPESRSAVRSAMPEQWTSIHGVENELKIAGFKDVKAEYVPTSMQFEAHEQVAKNMMSLPMVAGEFETWTPTELQSLREHMVEKMRKFQPSAPGILKGTAIACVGRK